MELVVGPPMEDGFCLESSSVSLFSYGYWSAVVIVVVHARVRSRSGILGKSMQAVVAERALIIHRWATPGFQHPQQTGVVANQPISEPMAPQAYQTGNNYSGAGYQGAPQMSQGHAAPPLNSTYYNDGAMPPQYPAETRPKK